MFISKIWKEVKLSRFGKCMSPVRCFYLNSYYWVPYMSTAGYSVEPYNNLPVDIHVDRLLTALWLQEQQLCHYQWWQVIWDLQHSSKLIHIKMMMTTHSGYSAISKQSDNQMDLQLKISNCNWHIFSISHFQICNLRPRIFIGIHQVHLHLYIRSIHLTRLQLQHLKSIILN